MSDIPMREDDWGLAVDLAAMAANAADALMWLADTKGDPASRERSLMRSLDRLSIDGKRLTVHRERHLSNTSLSGAEPAAGKDR